ncbi:hypothetical protein P886_1999 [Alteromonadaceae bacterium 2753L.S.0a.02]|nr:hypothetical protein P886_1999 [Alteromonadaceae bacterium 2753L.S.0a.02]
MTKDKIVVIGLILGFVAFSVYSWFPAPELKDFVRTLLGVGLCLCLYLGYTWSRWVIGVLSLLGAVFGWIVLAAGLASEQLNSEVLVFLIVCSFYSFAAFCLLNPRLLKSHFNRERITSSAS